MSLPASATSRANSSIEFVVVPRDDLFLEGGIRKLFRVSKGNSHHYHILPSRNNVL
jgi:hypothetical protein